MNTTLLQQRQSSGSAVMVVRVEEAEMDEMWSFVGSKQHQRWLWHAIDHRTGKVLAYPYFVTLCRGKIEFRVSQKYKNWRGEAINALIGV